MRPILWLFFAAATSAFAPRAGWTQPSPALDQVRQFTATFGPQTPRNDNGRRYGDHVVTLRAGQRYRISVTSTRFDPIVEVRRLGAAELIAEDDDSGAGLNARATLVVTEGGDYVVRALAFLPESTGAYFVRVEPAAALPPPNPTELPAGRTADRTAWTSYQGSLAETDASLDGVHFDDYLVTLAAGEELFVRLDAEAFDPLIQIYRATDRENEVLAADDDNGPGRNALLLFVTERAGDYVVRATAFGTTRTRGYLGDYRLRIGR